MISGGTRGTLRDAWQPIESAPADGKCIVWCATDDGGEMCILNRTARGDWLYEGQETFAHSFYIEPKFWMPLPAPPAEEAE